MHRLLILTIICGGVLGCSGDKADTMTRQSPDSGAEPPAETLNETLAEESPSGAEPEDHPTPAAPASPGPAQPQTPTDDARSNGVTTIRVFYGTDRKQTGSSVPNKFYGGEREVCRLGFATSVCHQAISVVSWKHPVSGDWNFGRIRIAT